MKLVLGIIQKGDTDLVLDALTGASYRATRLASTGGFRREGNTTLIIGVQDTQVDEVIGLLRETVAGRAGHAAPAADGSSGRGAVFVLPLSDSFQL